VEKFNNKLLFYFLLGIVTLFSLFVFSPSALAETFVTEDISADTIWNKAGSPYVIENSLAILSNATLTIDAGVVVKFESDYGGYPLGVLGGLIINGTENEKVYFTSKNDDAVGGNTNADIFCYDDVDENGNSLGEVCEDFGMDPEVGDWRGLIFYQAKSSLIKNTVFKYADQTLELYSSNVDFENLAVTKDYYGISVYENSYSKINKGTFDNLSGEALQIFNNSSIVADNLNIENLSGSEGQTILLFNNSKLSLNHSIIKNCPSDSCITFFDGYGYQDKPSVLNIENSKLEGGFGSGLLTFGGGNTVGVIKNSVIKDFAKYGVESYATYTTDARNNFWGNATGPYHTTLNPSGTAGTVMDGVLFDPWCKNETCKTHNPVILIPGITGSYLLKGDGSNDEVWPNLVELLLPGADSFLNYLALNTDGTEDPDRPVVLGDIIRGAVGVHVFDGLIDELILNGYNENTDLFVFPYDWRKSSAENAILLKNKIDSILENKGSEKIDIIAHSMGGLLAKKYIADTTGNKVDKMIFLGTPHLGAPKAFKVLMYGDSMGYSKLLLGLNTDRAKFISQNMPSISELLPSKKYVDGQEGFMGQKYVTDLVTPYISNPNFTPNLDLDYTQTKDFLINQGKNPKMFPFAEKLHESLDNIDLSSINVTNFSGCGFTKTVGGIVVKKKKSWTSLGKKFVDDFQLNYVNGDETVPLHSSIDSTGTKYYLKGTSHGSLPSADGLKQTVLSILNNEVPSNFENISSDIDSCDVSGKVVSVHSPVTLHVYDEAGNHTGIDAEGNIEENILGVQYDVIEGDKFAFLPDGVNYKVVSEAEDTGAYDFYIESIDGSDKKISTTYWNEIPLETLKARSEILIGPDISNYVVKIDEEGDGVYEREILPSSVLDSSKTQDFIPPQTKDIVLSNFVTLLATDDSSGILKTEYSLDGGSNWINYKDPIDASGKTVQYFSTDKAGNIESVKSVEVKQKDNPISNSGGGYLYNFITLNNLPVVKKIEYVKPIIPEKNPVENIVIANNNISVASDQNTDEAIEDFNYRNSQVASVAGFNINFQKYWPLYVLCLIVVLFIARIYIKR